MNYSATPKGHLPVQRKKGKPGLFELAHKGTIFLDEISEIPIELQGRLLRVLQEKEVMRIGDDKVLPVDVRIVCGTNKDLRKLISEGKFRKDLYYRINILPLYIPKLKERKEDIPILAKYFLKKYSEKYNKSIKYISEDSLDYLTNYDYDGNVRELEAMIERASILTNSDKIEKNDILIETENTGIHEKDDLEKFLADDHLTLDELNKEYIKYTLNKTNGSMKEASNLLGIDRTTIWRKLKE